MKPLSSVFNYTSTVVRYAESDDDQLLSWALQAWNLLNYPTLQKVKDFDIIDVVNYKAQLPTTKDKIIGIEVANDLHQTLNDYSRSTYFTGNNLLEFTKDTTLMTIVSFQSTLVPKDSVTSSTGLMYDNPLGIQTTYSGINNTPNQFVKILTNQTIDYLCRECEPTAQIVGNIATFNFDTGTILVHYYAPLKDANGEYLLPSEPEVIWHYLAKYIEEKHWYERGLMGEANGYQLYQAIKMERSNLHNDVKRKLTMMTMNIKDQLTMVYGPTRFLKMATMIHRKFSRRYEGTKIS